MGVKAKGKGGKGEGPSVLLNIVVFLVVYLLFMLPVMTWGADVRPPPEQRVGVFEDLILPKRPPVGDWPSLDPGHHSDWQLFELRIQTISWFFRTFASTDLQAEKYLTWKYDRKLPKRVPLKTPYPLQVNRMWDDQLFFDPRPSARREGWLMRMFNAQANQTQIDYKAELPNADRCVAHLRRLYHWFKGEYDIAETVPFPI